MESKISLNNWDIKKSLKTKSYVKIFYALENQKNSQSY